MCLIEQLTDPILDLLTELIDSGREFDFCAFDIALCLSDDPSETAILEALAGRSQREAVDRRIEPDWFNRGGVPAYAGGRGTFEQRRAAVVAHYRREQRAKAH